MTNINPIAKEFLELPAGQAMVFVHPPRFPSLGYRACSGINCSAYSKIRYQAEKRNIRFSLYHPKGWGAKTLGLGFVVVVKHRVLVETSNFEEDEGARYDREVLDAARDLAVRHGQDTMSMGTALFDLGANPHEILSVINAQRSKKYSEKMYRGKKVDERVVEVLKDFLRRKEGFS